MTTRASAALRLLSTFIPHWPLLIWLVTIALAIGLVGGLNTEQLISRYNASFGRSLGEFVLILLPSLMLAAAMNKSGAKATAGLVAGAAPLAGAGMVCASTAYAALSPAAENRRLDVAFGVHTGFKLLYPAGPLIVATGLGVETDSLLVYGFALLIPVWAVGALWVRFHGGVDEPTGTSATSFSARSAVQSFGPLLLLAVLLIAGSVLPVPNYAPLTFATEPKGALMLSATVALFRVAKHERRKCIDNAIRQTGELILIIGVASAFGGMLTNVVSLSSLIPEDAGAVGIASLFLLAVLFKLMQGSSMTVFVTAPSVAAPLIEAMGILPVVAVFSICFGTFVAILPNDSFYWLVRRDALAKNSEPRAIAVLAGGSTLQGITGLLIILLMASLGA